MVVDSFPNKARVGSKGIMRMAVPVGAAQFGYVAEVGSEVEVTRACADGVHYWIKVGRSHGYVPVNGIEFGEV